ncbi:hypothetical protein BOTCAL_0323g00040 [Botryotinia calthae]|uniref:Uncharacterized protein n=1 Tax=Botryotinia calthae TaxID=38488 RepID=A0A4Y8CTJ7_9HELO|nr:hypothetical protein BOTCAL_0323g00040 [Botryotinia calthae]
MEGDLKVISARHSAIIINSSINPRNDIMMERSAAKERKNEDEDGFANSKWHAKRPTSTVI